MKDTVTVGSGCGEVFVIQAGFFLQGSSACNLHSSFWYIGLSLLLSVLVLLHHLSITLDLKIESVYQTQWLSSLKNQGSRIRAQELSSKAQELKTKTIKTCRLIICITGSIANDLEQRTMDDTPRSDGQ